MSTSVKDRECFAALAPDLNRRRGSWLASMQYDIFMDAVVWDDELPRIKDDHTSFVMACVMRYRTLVQLGLPDTEGFQEYWQVAKTFFPDWIGFHPKRTATSPKLVAYYEEQSVSRLKNFLETFGLDQLGSDSEPSGQQT